MKFIILFTLLLITLVGYTSAQRCAGRPGNPACTGARDLGRRGRFLGLRCTARDMWYYDATARECLKMRYLGCGGNNNRWCNKVSCDRRCRPLV